MKYLLLDVAGTLLHKPSFYTKSCDVLSGFGYNFKPQQIKLQHKILSESIFFPDRTDSEFYRKFNSEFLYALGIVPTSEILDAIFSACTYLPWEKFDDTDFLGDAGVPIGIISNFNSTLAEKLRSHFHIDFAHLFVSETLGVAKPSPEFYKRALDQIGIPAGDITYVGDSVKLDLEPALAIGMNAYLIDRENYFPGQPRRLKSLYDLSKILK